MFKSKAMLILLAFTLILSLSFMNFTGDVQAETVTLRWATHPGPHTGPFEEYFVPEYEAMHDVEIIMEQLPPDDMWQQMMLEAQAGNPYDMGYHSPGWFGYYYEHVKGLDELIEKHDFNLDAYPDSVIESHMIHDARPGEIIAIARNPQTPFIVYREDWFNHLEEQEAFEAEYGRELAPPETWEELYEVAVFFTREAGETIAGEELEQDLYGYSASINAPGGMARAFLGIFYSLGLEGFDEDFQPDLDHEILLEGVEYWSELINETFPPAASTWDFLEHLSYYRDGRLAMAELWPEGVLTVKDPDGKAYGNTGFATLPKWEGNLKDLPIGRSFMGGGGHLIFDTPNAEEAFKFMQWVYEDQALEFNRRTAMFSREEHFTDPEVLEFHDFYEDFLPVFEEQLGYAFPRQPIPEWGAVMYHATGEFAADVVEGVMTPEEAQERWIQHMEREFEAAGYYD